MRRGASRVALAGLLSRIAGLVRERLFARYLGTSDVADAFGAAMRIPGVLESTLGEGAFASAFIPRYTRLLAEGSHRDARRLARGIAAIHVLVVTGVVLGGVLTAPLLVGVIAPGFQPSKAAFTVQLVRILFPAVGLLVIGSWCLGVLNSHRRFFLPYFVPVISAASISVALVLAGRAGTAEQIALAAAWGAVAGALLQLLVQLPVALAAVGRGEDSADAQPRHVTRVLRNLLPNALRGLVHRFGLWIEVAIAGFLSTGALAGLGYARVLYGLPYSLFTVAIAAALLPEMSSLVRPDGSLDDRVRTSLEAALRHAAYILVACAAAFIALGDVITAAIYQSGEFTASDARYVWAILGGMSFGLVGASMGGLYSTAFFALGDTVTPLRATLVRLAVRGTLGAVLAIPVTRALGLEPEWGAVGLAVAIGASGWIEFALLRRWLSARESWTSARFTGYLVRLWGVAAVAAGIAWGIRVAIPDLGPVAAAVFVLGGYSATYVLVTAALGIPEAKSVWALIRTSTRRS